MSEDDNVRQQAAGGKNPLACAGKQVRACMNSSPYKTALDGEVCVPLGESNAA